MSDTLTQELVFFPRSPITHLHDLTMWEILRLSRITRLTPGLLVGPTRGVHLFSVLRFTLFICLSVSFYLVSFVFICLCFFFCFFTFFIITSCCLCIFVLCLVCPMLLVSLGCPFFSATSIYSHVYLMIDLISFLVFNATFSNISAISWRPVLVMEEVVVPAENHRPWASSW